jgi:uncharacterized membrane protein YedE/YeeE
MVFIRLILNFSDTLKEMGEAMNILKKTFWAPYSVGILIGLLSWFANLSADQFLGITTPFEYTAAFFVKPFLSGIKYFQENNPKLGWEWMLVLGVFLGAYVSSKISGDRKHSHVPRLWESRFGNNERKRMLCAFVGGFIMMYGARTAQGCTSGHGISGILQFALSSWIFVPVFGLSGILVAKLIYSKTRRIE